MWIRPREESRPHGDPGGEDARVTCRRKGVMRLRGFRAGRMAKQRPRGREGVVRCYGKNHEFGGCGYFTGL